MTVGERLQQYRKLHNLSQEELAKQLFVTRQTISLWETDQTLPTIDNLVRLKDILEISIDDILTGPQENSGNDEEQPLEKYEFKYNKPIFKSVRQTIYAEKNKIYIFLLSMSIINIIRIDHSLTNTFVLGQSYIYLLFIGLIYMLFLFKTRKEWNPRNSTAYKNIYIYDIYADYIMITTLRDNIVTSTKRIIPYSIKRCWSTTDLYIFQVDKEIYCIKKHGLDSNSIVHRYYSIAKHQQKSGNGTVSKGFRIFSLVVFVLTLLCFPVVFLCIYSIWEDGVWFGEYAWMMYLALPIPILSIIISIISNKKGVKNTKNLLAGIIVALMLCLYGAFAFIDNPKEPFNEEHYNEVQAEINRTFLSEIEYQTKIRLPASSILSSWDYSLIYDDAVYWEGKNIVTSNSVANITFSPSDARIFEKEIQNSELWMDNISSDYAVILPSGTEEIFVGADYHLIYNTDKGIYNTVPTEKGEYHFFYLFYYSDENILKAIKYTKYIGAEKPTRPPKTIDVFSDDDGMYSLIVYRTDGRIMKVYSGINAEPDVHVINGKIARATVNSAEGLHESWTEYYDMTTGNISKKYYYVLTELEDKVIYVKTEKDKHYIVISDFFDENIYNKQVLLENSSPVNDPIAGFGIEDEFLQIIYFQGENEEKATISIELN